MQKKLINDKFYANISQYAEAIGKTVNTTGLTAEFITNRENQLQESSVRDFQSKLHNELYTIVLSVISPEMVKSTYKKPKAIDVILKPEHRYVATKISIQQLVKDQDQFSITVSRIKKNNKTTEVITKGSISNPIIGVTLPITLKSIIQ